MRNRTHVRLSVVQRSKLPSSNHLSIVVVVVVEPVSEFVYVVVVVIVESQSFDVKVVSGELSKLKVQFV